MSCKNKNVQKVWCCQCEVPMSPRCPKCIADPTRKPRVVEIYDAPPILRTNDCGCVGFKCQRVGCTTPGLVWRHPRADGTLGLKNHFCSPACVRIVTAAARRLARIKEPCSCGCGRICERHRCDRLRFKHVYFSRKCQYAHKVKMKADARRLEAKGDDQFQTFCCNSGRPECRENPATDHEKGRDGHYRCVRCHFAEPAPSTNGTVGVAK